MQDGEDGNAEPEIREPTLADMSSLFQAHMAKIDACEAYGNSEYAKQESRFKILQRQFSLLQLEVHACTTQTPEQLPSGDDLMGGPGKKMLPLGPTAPVHYQSELYF